MRGKLENIEEAIQLMRKSGISVQERAYGFSLVHPEYTDTRRSFATCNCEHDCSISLSVRVDANPPILHFARFDLLEMATFIISAYGRVTAEADSIAIADAMRVQDIGYDYSNLATRLDQWRRDFDDYCRGSKK